MKPRKYISKSETGRETFSRLYEGTAKQLVHAQFNSEYDENFKKAFSQGHNSSDDSVRFTLAPERTRQTGNRNENERVLDQII